MADTLNPHSTVTYDQLAVRGNQGEVLEVTVADGGSLAVNLTDNGIYWYEDDNGLWGLFHLDGTSTETAILDHAGLVYTGNPTTSQVALILSNGVLTITFGATAGAKMKLSRIT